MALFMPDPDYGPYSLILDGRVILKDKTLSRIQQYLIRRILSGEPAIRYEIRRN